jgi:hypothetical protein
LSHLGPLCYSFVTLQSFFSYFIQKILTWLATSDTFIFLKSIFTENKETQQNDEYLHHLPKTTPLKSNSKHNQSPKG